MSHLLPLLGLLAAPACVPALPDAASGDVGDSGAQAEGPDLDADGYSAADGDCSDQSAAISPGATEVCDGIDNDCDGLAGC